MKNKLVIILVLAILVLIGTIAWYKQCRDWRPAGPGAEFVINKGDGVNQISDNLYNSGLIRSKTCFKLYVWLAKKQAVMKAGQYDLGRGYNIKELVGIFTSGETVSREKNITIIEGWRNNDIAAYLVKEGIDKKNEFSTLAGRSVNNWALGAEKPGFLSDAPATADMEGFLFPDTYRIFKDATTRDVIEKMLANFNKKLDDKMRQDIKAQGRTIYETVTMASIIEKEVKSYEDMQIVSGIFWDRIKIGQALESCATLAYILGENKSQYTQADTEIDSPYNTYENRGLPPGPICNPGLNAIKAAVYPKYSDYNYFLSRPDTGQTVFSKTYDEHLANKARYLK